MHDAVCMLWTVGSGVVVKASGFRIDPRRGGGLGWVDRPPPNRTIAAPIRPRPPTTSPLTPGTFSQAAPSRQGPIPAANQDCPGAVFSDCPGSVFFSVRFFQRFIAGWLPLDRSARWPAPWTLGPQSSPLFIRPGERAPGRVTGWWAEKDRCGGRDCNGR